MSILWRLACELIRAQGAAAAQNAAITNQNYFPHGHHFHDRSSLSQPSNRVIDRCCTSLLESNAENRGLKKAKVGTLHKICFINANADCGLSVCVCIRGWHFFGNPTGHGNPAGWETKSLRITWLGRERKKLNREWAGPGIVMIPNFTHKYTFYINKL